MDLQVTFDVLHFGAAGRNPALNSHMVTTTLFTFFWCFFVFTILGGISSVFCFFLHFFIALLRSGCSPSDDDPESKC